MKIQIATLFLVSILAHAAFCDDITSPPHKEVDFNCQTGTCLATETAIGFGSWVSFAPFEESVFLGATSVAVSHGDRLKVVYTQQVKDDAAVYLVDPDQLSVLLKSAIDQVRLQRADEMVSLSDQEIAAILLQTY